MTVGRDGRVYLAGGAHDQGFVLRVSRDGTDRFGGQTAYAITGVAANEQGVFATANAHFAKAVHVYGPDWDLIGKTGGFTGNDQVGWNSPGAVEAGASGDYYGLDQHENAVVRISPEAKIVRKYPIDADGVPGQSKLRSFRFRVCEATESFYFDTSEGIRCADFAGHTRWIAPVKMAGDVYSGFAGSFDVDGEGRLSVIDGTKPLIRQFDAAGNESGQIELDFADDVSYQSLPVQELRVWEGEIILRRRSETLLFEVFDQNSGKRLRQVPIAHERLTVHFDGFVWHSGERIGFGVDFAAHRLNDQADAGLLRPELKVWMRPLSTVHFTRWAMEDDHVEVPADASGLYQVRVTAGLDGAESAYLVQTVVEVRPAGAVGSISLFAPRNRSHYGRGIAGEPSGLPVGKTVQVARRPPEQWQKVRIDLWKEWGQDFPLRSLSIAAVGGGAAFDGIRLGRSEADLERAER